MNNYDELEAKVREQAAAEWDSTHTGESQKERNQRRAFISEKVNEWFCSTELYSSIVIRRDKSVEIEDRYFGSSITIYPPQRDYTREGEVGERKVKIIPAYMNASTWQTGGSHNSVEFVQRRTLQYLKMVEIAFDTQNEMNQVLIDWNSMENPFSMTQWQKQDLERYRTAERDRIAQEREKKAAKEAKKLAGKC